MVKLLACRRDRSVVQHVGRWQGYAQVSEELGTVTHVLIGIAGVEASARYRAVFINLLFAKFLAPLAGIAPDSKIIVTGAGRGGDKLAMDAVRAENPGFAFGFHVHCHLSIYHSI